MRFWRRRDEEATEAPTAVDRVDPEQGEQLPGDPAWEPDPADFEDPPTAPEPAGGDTGPAWPPDVAAPLPVAASPVVASPEPEPVAPDMREPAAALDAGLERTRGGFMSRLRGFLGTAETGGPSWDDVEETLIGGDVGASPCHRARRACPVAA